MNDKDKTAENFVKAYEEFCKEWGFRIAAKGKIITLPTNHGTFELGVEIQYGVTQNS